MLSAGCYFRNDWMNRSAATSLLELWCKDSDLLPQYWNTYEPVNRSFNPSKLEECASELVATNNNLGASILLARRKKPRLWGDISLWRRPTHNDVYVGADDLWPSGALKLREFIENWVDATGGDFAYVADAQKEDEDRFVELKGVYTAEEIRVGVRRAPPFIATSHKRFHVAGAPAKHFSYHPYKEEMYGPAGHLWDIVWYNYFGSPYVDLIGKDRLRSAGWAHVDEMAGGLGCLVTESIEDPTLREKRDRIRNSLHEFVWTPGCKREEKRAPLFNFSAQLAHAPAAAQDGVRPLIVFGGLSKKEQKQAIKALEEQSGKEFDPVTRSLRPKRKKK